MSLIDREASGVDKWMSGSKAKKRNGRYTEMGIETESATEGFRPAQHWDCSHAALRGCDRCVGCGRTRNEIALDGER